MGYGPDRSRQKGSLSVNKVPALAANDDRQIARPSGLAEEVYRRIRADIMSLKLPPESRVSVDSLARELGVSQTPIREALSMLEANGLVSKRHFAGYATTPRMDRAQLDELFEFRLLIEPHAARKAAADDEPRPTWRSWPAARPPRHTMPSPTWIPISTA